jgi:5-methylcytosine-specific restriction endonuclease McrA
LFNRVRLNVRGEPWTGTLQKPVSRAAEKQQRDRDTEREWQKVRKAVLARDLYRCRCCGSADKVEVHHLKPRSLGREDSTANTLVLCAVHHAERHAYRLFIDGRDANGRLKFSRIK